MPACCKCNAEIPFGRKYCSLHYQEAVERYESALIEYEYRMAAWNESSPEDRRRANAEEENWMLLLYAAAFGLALGLTGWYYASKFWNIDNLYGIGILLVTIIIFISLRPLRIFCGHVSRIAIKAAFYFLILAIISYLLSLISNLVNHHIDDALYASAALAIVTSFLFETTGEHRASAMPRKPTPPSP